MALSKLAIGLIAGTGSVATIGGITAGVVVLRNNTVVETASENDEYKNKENKTSNDAYAVMNDESRTDSSNARSSDKEMKDSRMDSMTKSEEPSTTVMEEQKQKTVAEQQEDSQTVTNRNQQDPSASQPAKTPENGQVQSSQAQENDDGSATAGDGKAKAEDEPEKAQLSGIETVGAEGEGEPQDL